MLSGLEDSFELDSVTTRQLEFVFVDGFTGEEYFFFFFEYFITFIYLFIYLFNFLYFSPSLLFFFFFFFFYQSGNHRCTIFS